MDKAQLVAMLAECTPQELRVLRYEVAGGHSCNNTTSLHHCCNEARCEPCHVLHLKAKHDEPALWAYEKFVDKWCLTWAGYVPTKQKKVKERFLAIEAALNAPIPKVNKKAVPSANSIADAVNDDNLEQVLALLAKKLGRTT